MIRLTSCRPVAVRCPYGERATRGGCRAAPLCPTALTCTYVEKNLAGQAFGSLTVGQSGVEWGAVGRGASPHGCGEVRPVFLGTHSPRLDDKGRLFLPA